MCLSTFQFEGNNWYLVRRNAKTDSWHPANDNALGTDIYGTKENNPIGADTFSVQYSQWKWDKIMFAWGNLGKWIVFDRTIFEAFTLRDDCANCVIDFISWSESDTETIQLNHN